jgi:hypothetical protein
MTKQDVNSLLQEHGDNALVYLDTITPEELEEKIKALQANGHGGGKFGEEPQGGEQSEQSEQKDDYDGSVPPAGLHIDTGKTLKQFPYQVKYTIPKKGRGILVGQSGVSKTGIAIHLGIVNAAFKGPDGKPFTFFGRRLKEQIGVIYLAAEGEGEIQHRVRAAKLELGLKADEEIPFVWCAKNKVLDGAASLGDEKGKAAFIEFCKRTAAWMRKRFNVRLGLIIGDTASALYAIEDENDGAEIAQLAKDFGDIIGALKEDCFGLLVVHAGKDAKRGARGSQAWRDNFDIMLMASGERNELEGTCSNRRLTLSKNRFGREGIITAYDVKEHVLGQDDDGDDFGAQVVFAIDGKAAKKPGRSKKPAKYRPQFEHAFNAAILDHPVKRRLRGPAHLMAPELTCVDREHVRTEFYRICSEETKDAKRVAFTRLLETLFQEYPKEEDEQGRMWIWKVQP